MNVIKKFPDYPEDEINIKKIERINDYLREQENYYKPVQIEFKKDAFRWVFVTFAAVGFTLFKKYYQLPIEPYVLVFFISCCGFFAGVLPYSIYDSMIYQRFIDAIFYEGLKLEKAFPWLPQCRHNALKNSKWLRRNSILFYFINGTFLLFTSGYFLSVWVLSFSTIGGAAVIIIIILLIFLIYLFLHKIHFHLHKIFLRFSLENIDNPSSIPEDVWEWAEEEHEKITQAVLKHEDSKIKTKETTSLYFLYVFLGMGFILSTDTSIIATEERLFLTAFIGFLGFVGNSLIFLVYMGSHRELNAVIFEALKLEMKYNTLPPFLLNMLASQKGRGIEHLHVLEFIFRNLVLLSITALALDFLTGKMIGSVIITFMCIVFMFGSSLWMLKHSKSCGLDTFGTFKE